MLTSGGYRLSKMASCLEASHHFLPSELEAKAIIDRQREAIESHWESVCDEAHLSAIDRKLFWKRQFLNPFVFED